MSILKCCLCRVIRSFDCNYIFVHQHRVRCLQKVSRDIATLAEVNVTTESAQRNQKQHDILRQPSDHTAI